MNPVFREATTADDAALREIFRTEPMEGDIGICFEREPSFFRARQPQGQSCRTFVCEDMDSGEIMGMGSRSVSKVWINGEVKSAAYLSDLRVRNAYKGGLWLARAYRYLGEMDAADPVDITYSVIFESNLKALSTIAKGRGGIPMYHYQGRWDCPALWFGKEKRLSLPGIDVSKSSAHDLPEVIAWLNQFSRGRNFSPVYRLEDFDDGGRWQGLDPGSIFIAREKGELVGVVGVWDQKDFKQSRVVSYSKRMLWVAAGSRLAAPILGTPSFPKAGQCLNYINTGFNAAASVEVYQLLLSIVHDAYRHLGYQYILTGIHEKDPLAVALASFRQTSFHGVIFTVDYGATCHPDAGLDSG